MTKQRAKAQKTTPVAISGAAVAATPIPERVPTSIPLSGLTGTTVSPKRRIRVTGTIPPELWNRLGTKLIPKIRAGEDLRVGIDISVEVEGTSNLESELRLILKDLELEGRIRIENE